MKSDLASEVKMPKLQEKNSTRRFYRLLSSLVICLVIWQLSSGHAQTIIMYWDGSQSTDDVEPTKAGITLAGQHWNDEMIPPAACGFRLMRIENDWNEAWFFGEYGNFEKTFVTPTGIEYSSSGAHLQAGLRIAEYEKKSLLEYIEARGPVHGCDSGAYDFVTPLSVLSIYGTTIDAQISGADDARLGSFHANFNDFNQIYWLDYAGNVIPPMGVQRTYKDHRVLQDFFNIHPTL